MRTSSLLYGRTPAVACGASAVSDGCRQLSSRDGHVPQRVFDALVVVPVTSFTA